MKRITIGEELRRKANASNDHQIFLADPRDIIGVVDKINELVDAYNRDHQEIDPSELRDFLRE